MAANSARAYLIALQASERAIPPQLLQEKQRAIDQARDETRSLFQSGKELGYVFCSGGSDRVSPSKSPMDWAVIEPNPSDTVWNRLKELNQVRFPSPHR